jgi:hypothetical protein
MSYFWDALSASVSRAPEITSVPILSKEIPQIQVRQLHVQAMTKSTFALP